MKTWMTAICILLSAFVCHGQKNVGPVTFALDTENAKTTVEEYYKNQSILKIYKDGEWKDAKNVSIDKNAPTYVISHGLNSTCDKSGWINDSAAEIAVKDPAAIIISVNWDCYSGTESNIKDSNFGASSWINSVSPVLAKELGEFTNIKSFIGHSYGAHLLADTMVKMKGDGNLKESRISFVALDPAEETLAFTGDKNGKSTWMGSDNKKSKDWGLPDNVTSEVYKSSGFLGSEERLGDYNYFLATEGSITPRGVLGDLDTGSKKLGDDNVSNHSLAPAWFAEMLKNGHFGADDSGLIGGWFNSETDSTRGNRSSDYWDGVVNANTSLANLKLEYAARENEKFTEWQDLCNAEAQYLLRHDLDGKGKDDKLNNWNGTILNPSKYKGYQLFHGNDQKASDELDNKISNAAYDQSKQTPGELPSDNPLNNIPTVNSENSTIENVNATLELELEKLKNSATTEDARGAIQAAGEIIKEKIKEAWERGEKWVEEGGIRKLLLTQLDKNLTGKVSDADKQHILNMADKLCNINKDGGRSFAESLGTDGLPLLRSLAVQQLQKEISKALPKDVADNINNYIQMLAIDGYDLLDPAAKQQLLDIVKSAISEYLPYENTAQTLNKIIQDIYDGKAGTVLDMIGQVGTSLGIDLLKDALAKNLDPETAAKINALLDAYAQDGLQGLTEAARAELFAMIDKAAPGAESAQAIKNLLDGIMNGTVTATDFKNTVSSIAGDVANKLIDQSNLSPEAKHAAKEAIEVLKKNGFTGITDAAQTFIQDYVKSKLGEEAGQAVADIFHAIVTPGEDVWTAIETNLPIIGKAVGATILAKVEAAAVKQIDKFIANHPALAKIAEILGIDGQGIVNGIKNIWGILQNATSLKDALSKIGRLMADGLKNLALNALKWGVQKLTGILNNLIDKAVDWLKKKLSGLIGKVNNKLVQAGLSWLADQATKCAKCGAQKVVSKASAAALKWIESQRPVKPQSSTPVVR